MKIFRRKTKYYTLESFDGNLYMAYSNIKQAKEEYQKYSYSGLCKEHIVGDASIKISFIW